MGTERYGQFYWCVKVPKTISKNGEIYLHANVAKVDDVGTLWMLGGCDGGLRPLLVIPANKWIAIYAASCIDGAAVAVDHWEGEVVR